MPIPPDQADTAALLARLSGAAPLETHISAVFRGPDTVWKLKKAVRLGFLDFTRLPDRERFLRRELALNEPHAPGLYRDVVPVTRTPSGLDLDGPGTPVDWVLRMAPVPPSDFLDERARAGGLDDKLLTDLADAVAAMHAAQPPVPGHDPVAALRTVIAGNARAAKDAGLHPAFIATWRARIETALAAAAPALAARAPLVRRAHGDLHLGNLMLWQGRPVPFDALEFDEDLATIDPGYDLAFLLMDLERLQSRAAANHVLNRYVARTGDASLVAGLPAFLSLRATVRAHVEAARGNDPAPLAAAALSVLDSARPVVLAIGGLMGTGKTTLARALAPTLGPAPGALVLRTDEIRKRLHGVAPEDRLPRNLYAPSATARTEDALLHALSAAAGHAVIADATFTDPAFRARVEAAARAANLPFLGVWLHAPLPELERRVAARRDDASDATVSVLRRAHAATHLPADWLHIEATDAAAIRENVQTRLTML